MRLSRLRRVDRARTSPAPEPQPQNANAALTKRGWGGGLGLMRGHVNDGCAYVDAIREHFCSVGLCDDSFMSTPVEEGAAIGRQG